MFKFRPLSLLIILVDVILIGLTSKYRWYTKLIYTEGINRFIRERLGDISGLVSFSIGEVLTFAILGGIVFFIVKLIMLIIKKEKMKDFLFKSLCLVGNILLYGSLVYLLVFGLNFQTPTLNRGFVKAYNQRHSRNIKTSVDNDKRVEVYKLLEQKVKQAKSMTTDNNQDLLENTYLLSDKIGEDFNSISGEFPVLKGHYSNAKDSMISDVMQSLGMDGRYYMLTGEVVINNNIPLKYRPFVMAKYTANQRGIAREDEALFYAYKSCISSDNMDIKYSGYLSALYMVLESLSIYDKIDYNEFVVRLDPEIKKDMEEIYQYKKSYGIVALGKDYLVKNFYKVNGDIRMTDIDTQLISLLFSYYSLENKMN